MNSAVLALRAGALDFLSKDKPGRFLPAVVRVLREAADRVARAAAEAELRRSEERYRLGFLVSPVALLTYDRQKGDQERALAAGGDDDGTKPIDMRALPGVLSRHVARGRGGEA